MEAITPIEYADLVRLESIISRNEGAMLETAVALRTIKERKLYRSDFDSFEDYCRTRWNFTRQRGYQLIVFAEEVSVSTSVDTCPKNESEARRIRSQRKQANRKPTCDTPPRNPPPVIDAEIAREIVRESEAKEREQETPAPELPPHIKALIEELEISRDNCDVLIGCVQSDGCDAETIKDVAKHLKKLASLLLAYAAERQES